MTTARAAVAASPKPRAKSKARPRPPATPPATPKRPEKRKPPPSSPSTSSARPRKKAREPPRQSKRSTRPGSTSHCSSALTLFGLPFQPDIKYVVPQHRVFTREFQDLLFAFGDARFCSRDTLELVEDAVRTELRRLASTGLDAALTRLDARAVHRLNTHFKACRIPRRLPLHRFGESLTSATDSYYEPAIATIRYLSEWTGGLLYKLRLFMSPHDFLILAHNRTAVFTKSQSSSSDPNIQGADRATLFKSWIGLPCSDADLAALSHLTWELTGQLVQTALLRKHHTQLQLEGHNPCSLSWSDEKHWMDAIGHGIATALAIPCSDHQALALGSDIRRYINRMNFLKHNWRPTSDCLLPHHIYAALDHLRATGWGGEHRLRAGLFDSM